MVIIGAMVVMAAFGWLSMLNAALRATLALLLTGCLNLRAAGRGVEFGTLVVLAAAVGLESADSQRPISVSLARQLEVNYMPFANGLMMGASAFISPPAYQITDFVKIGLPLTVLVRIVTVITAPLVFGC